MAASMWIFHIVEDNIGNDQLPDGYYCKIEEPR